MERVALDFMNSDWSDYRGSGRREDRLRKPEWVESFLDRWSLETTDRLGPKTLETLTALRDAMWRIVDDASARRSVADRDLGVVNDALGASTPRRRVVREKDGYSVDLVPPRHDWAWVRSEVAADFVSMMAEYGPERLKRCENDDCGWVFFDDSKGQNRRWCDASCSNLIRVRRFRERHRRA